MSNTLEKNIHGFNVIATYTHIEPSEILDDLYKVDFRMLQPKLSVVFKHLGKSVVKEYTLSAMDLAEKVSLPRTQRKIKSDALYVKDGCDRQVVYQEEKRGRRSAIVGNTHSSSALTLDELGFSYKPTQEDLMYILRNLLSDQMMVWEYDENEFAELFMGDCSIESLRKADSVYSGLKSDIFNLNVRQEQVYAALDKLTEMEIE